ncbi:MAG TPA: hypothetical protein VLQ93_08705 [Myxococcaceae bacterium]|nr:hypothetical protein [Myxococcaceae bacterium]
MVRLRAVVAVFRVPRAVVGRVVRAGRAVVFLAAVLFAAVVFLTAVVFLSAVVFLAVALPAVLEVRAPRSAVLVREVRRVAFLVPVPLRRVGAFFAVVRGVAGRVRLEGVPPRPEASGSGVALGASGGVSVGVVGSRITAPRLSSVIW